MVTYSALIPSLDEAKSPLIVWTAFRSSREGRREMIGRSDPHVSLSRLRRVVSIAPGRYLTRYPRFL